MSKDPSKKLELQGQNTHMMSTHGGNKNNMLNMKSSTNIKIEPRPQKETSATMYGTLENKEKNLDNDSD